MAISKNIITDYGAVGDGVTNDWQSFADFRTFARGRSDQVTLTIPAGTYHLDAGIESELPFDGIPWLVVEATSATFPPVRLTGTGGFSTVAGKSARVQTILAGAASAICTTAAHAARFPVGRWAALTALELQGDSGFPPNHQYFQFVRIVSADDGTGVVTFTPPARQDYKSTYPATSSGDYDTGGPATLHLMDFPDNGTGGISTAWDTDVTVNGLTLVGTGANEEIPLPGRRVILNDVVFDGCAPNPTVSAFTQFNRVACNIGLELDKEIERLELNDCDFTLVSVQSASIDTMVLDGTSCSVALNGTARHTIIRNGCNLLELKVGAIAYGTSESLTFEGPEQNTISSLVYTNTHRREIADFGNSGGRLTYNGGDVLPIGAPGSLVFLGGSSRVNGGYPSWVFDIEDNGGLARLVTKIGDPIPTLPAVLMGATTYLVQHPCLSISTSDAAGCDEILDLVAAPDGLPLFSYGTRTGHFSNAENITIFGRLKRMVINVTQPYTGEGDCILHAGAIGDNAEIINPDGTQGLFGSSALINARIGGERIITPTIVSGAQSGDTLSAPGNIWFVEVIGPQLSKDVSGEAAGVRPIIVVTIETDQLPRMTVPLSMRLAG